MSLRTDLKSTLRHKVNLSLYTTMQVGGPATYFAEPANENELSELVEYAVTEKIPYFILGKGSNVLFSDEGFPGLVITTIHMDHEKVTVDVEKSRATASAGMHLYRFVLALRDAGLGGGEFLANIPGTIGGALMMNAGFSRFPGQTNEIGDIAEEVCFLDEHGKRQTWKRDELDFKYRRSNLRGKVILSGTFQLWPRDKEEIQKEIKANFDYRNSKQDLKHPSSGSIFKNPGLPHPSAGLLIEKAGLKGFQVGGAMVSAKHGNYIVNAGGAKTTDVLQLIEKVQKAVFESAGVFLEPEVHVIEVPKNS